MTLLRERERSDDNDARVFLLSNTAEERFESLGPLRRIALEIVSGCRMMRRCSRVSSTNLVRDNSDGIL
jgi:hypothetical protein